MGKASSSKKTLPLLSQWRVLCFWLLYLSTILFIVLYTRHSKTNCLFRSSNLEPVQNPLFSYPSSYGEHKYAIQTLRSNCSSSVSFSDYWKVTKEIDNLCKARSVSSSSSSSNELRYLKGNDKADSFGGNFCARERFSYFDRRNESSEIPCGFFKDFPISNSDRIAMENCRGVVIVSAIFNDYDKIRQPKGVGAKTLQTSCFYMFVDDVTLKALKNHNLLLSQKPGDDIKVGAWKIVRVSTEDLYDEPAMNGVIPKYLIHRLFPSAKFSIWIDAKLRLMVDPLLLIHSLLVSENASMAISKHPFFVHAMEEAVATARWKKLRDVDGLRMQMETYCEFGLKPWSDKKLPYTSDVPDSALILRKHDMESNLFSCLMFNELEGFNHRDQLAFAYVRDHMNPTLKINMFEVQVFEQITVEYRHNLKKSSSQTMGTTTTTWTKTTAPDLSFVNSSCHNYFLEMWGQTD